MLNSEEIFEGLEKIRTSAPLVHNITNYVVMNNTANALLAIGASPVMAHAIEEVEEMVSFASCLVINMGTLSEKWVDAMLKAGQKALENGTPIVFDPVGVGATKYRSQTADKIIEICKPSVIRGNASEIMALSNSNITTKGVDSTKETNEAENSAKELALRTSAVVVISGEIDYITDGKTVMRIKNGSRLMTKLTGMGCTATAIIGAYLGVEKDILRATTMAMATMGICGQLAANISKGPGSMQVNFIDTLYNLSQEQISSTLIQ